MNKLTGPKTIQIANIKTTFFVRIKLDEDRVLFLSDLYQNDTKIPPIVVNANGELIDGRHRLEAMRLLDWTECKAFIDESTNRLENIVAAMKANMGGALPPTPGDIEATIELLLAEGMKQIDIKAAFPIPPSIITKYIANVKKRIYSRTLGNALDNIATRGWTVARAADHFGIPEEDLKAKISNRKKKGKTISEAMHAGLEFRTRGYSQYMRGCLGKLRKAVMDGEATRLEFDEFASHATKAAKGIMRTIETNKERIDASGNLAGLEEE